MVALTATHWSISSSDVKVFREDPYRRVARMVVVTAGEYPSNGIPVPPASKFGLRVLNRLTPLTNAMKGATASTVPEGLGMFVNYDHTHKTIRLMALSTTSIAAQSLNELATTAVPGAIAIYVEVNGH